MFISKRSVFGISSFFLGAAIAPLTLAGPIGGQPGYTPEGLPPNPSAGKCYARVEIPAQYNTTSERVVIEDAKTRVDIVQAVLAPRQEKVLVKEASTRFRVRQPSYKTVSERIVTRPAYEKLSVSPPQYKTVTETVQTSAPTLVWKRGNPGDLVRKGYKIHSTADGGYNGQGYSSTTQYGQSGGANCGPTCEIWCLVEEPGATTQFNRKVISVPGQVRRTTVPARHQTIMKRVVSDPGGVDQIPVPAEYQTITVEEVITPAGEKTSIVPAQYGNVEKKTLVSPARYEWREVICKPGTGGISGSSHSSSSYSSGSSSYSSGSSSYGSGSAYTGGSHSSGSSVSSGTIQSGHSGVSSYGSGSGYSSSSGQITGTAPTVQDFQSGQISSGSIGTSTTGSVDSATGSSYGSGFSQPVTDTLNQFEGGRIESGAKRVKKGWF